MFPHSVLQTLLAWQGVRWERSGEKYGQQRPRAFFGLYGVLETSWCLKTRLSQLRGLKLILYLIYGFGLICLAMLIQTLS